MHTSMSPLCRAATREAASRMGWKMISSATPGSFAPELLILHEADILALFPLVKDVAAGADEVGLLIAGIVVSVLREDDQGVAGQHGQELVGIAAGDELHGVVVDLLHTLHQAQGSGHGRAVRIHGLLIGEDHVVGVEGGAVAEAGVLHQVEHQVGVVRPLPALRQAGQIVVVLIGQEDQGLVGQGKAVVVDLVVLGLGVQLVDVGSDADGQGRLDLSRAGGIPCVGAVSGVAAAGVAAAGVFTGGAASVVATTGSQAEQHHKAQQECKELLHLVSPFLLFGCLTPVRQSIK